MIALSFIERSIIGDEHSLLLDSVANEFNKSMELMFFFSFFCDGKPVNLHSSGMLVLFAS